MSCESVPFNVSSCFSPLSAEIELLYMSHDDLHFYTKCQHADNHSRLIVIQCRPCHQQLLFLLSSHADRFTGCPRVIKNQVSGICRWKQVDGANSFRVDQPYTMYVRVNNSLVTISSSLDTFQTLHVYLGSFSSHTVCSHLSSIDKCMLIEYLWHITGYTSINESPSTCKILAVQRVDPFIYH